MPSIRKYGTYTLEQKNKQLVLELEEIKRDLKKEYYPDGGIVYCIDYSDNTKEIYRIGKTDNMKKRLKIYNTHSVHNKKVVHHYQTKCPLGFETCVKVILYEYRIKNKKDMFVCTKNDIINAFDICKQAYKC